MAHCGRIRCFKHSITPLPSTLLSSPFLVQKIYVCREAVRANLIALPCRHQRVGWDCRVKSTNSSPDHPNMRSTSWVLSNRPSFYDFSAVQSNPFSWKRICDWQLFTDQRNSQQTMKEMQGWDLWENRSHFWFHFPPTTIELFEVETNLEIVWGTYTDQFGTGGTSIAGGWQHVEECLLPGETTICSICPGVAHAPAHH